MFGGTDLQIDYEMVEDMIRAFRGLIEQFDVSHGAVQNSVQILQGGGMVSKEGERMISALNDRFMPGIVHSQDRVQEMIDELEATLRLLRDGDNSARSRFVD